MQVTIQIINETNIEIIFSKVTFRPYTGLGSFQSGQKLAANQFVNVTMVKVKGIFRIYGMGFTCLLNTGLSFKFAYASDQKYELSSVPYNNYTASLLKIGERSFQIKIS